MGGGGVTGIPITDLSRLMGSPSITLITYDDSLIRGAAVSDVEMDYICQHCASQEYHLSGPLIALTLMTTKHLSRPLPPFLSHRPHLLSLSIVLSTLSPLSLATSLSPSLAL